MGAFQFGSSRQARLNQSAQLTHLNEHQHLIHRHRSPKSEAPPLTDAEIQHLKRRGVYIPPHAVTPDADRSRSLQSGENPTPHSASWWRQWVDWWESTRWEKTLEMVVQDLENLALLDLLAVTANITIVFSLWSFVADGPDREKQKHYQAWNVINSAALISSASTDVMAESNTDMVASRVGSSGEGGRTAAIEELYEDRQSLAGLNAPQAYLPFLNLSSRYRCLPTEFLTLNFSALNTQAPLMVRTPIQIVGGQGWSLGQTLQFQCPLTRGRVQADLAKANLEEAYLGGANFAWANMVGIFLKGAALAGVDLTGANLRHAHLQGVFLGGEDLEGNYLGGADLDHAKLQGANLREAYFELTQLNQTNFEDAILHRSIFFGVDLAQAQNVDWSQFAPNQGEDTIVLCRVQLPAGVEVDPDRDCEQLHQIFADRYPEVFEEAEIAQGYVQFVYGQIDQQTLIDP